MIVKHKRAHTISIVLLFTLCGQTKPSSNVKPLLIGSAMYTAGYLSYYLRASYKVSEINRRYTALSGTANTDNPGWAQKVYDSIEKEVKPLISKELRNSPKAIYEFYVNRLQNDLNYLNYVWKMLTAGGALIYWNSELQQHINDAIPKCEELLTFLHQNKQAIIAYGQNRPKPPSMLDKVKIAVKDAIDSTKGAFTNAAQSVKNSGNAWVNSWLPSTRDTKTDQPQELEDPLTWSEL